MDAIRDTINDINKRFFSCEIRLDEPLKNYTSFRIGGSVRAMIFPKSAGELSALLNLFCGRGVKPFIMGNGTNLLVDDQPLDIIVIKMSGLAHTGLTNETEITADSGILLSRLAVFACENGLTGLEFAHGIPGTLGGAVSMNAGAYGGEMKDVVKETKVLSGDNAAFTVTGGEHGFSYRESRFSDTDDIILSSVIKLHKGDPKEIKAKMDVLAAKRRDSQPLNIPSAGSTFKRPKNSYAAALIEQAGLKGFMIGGAQVSEKHAGFVINRGGAAFSDVIGVIEHVRETVMQKFGTELETEVKVLRA